ncbi:MAG TPA: GNAT family N-acetyltransferase [Spirochaetota bacterium]|nr:GNAT family N-acetyltransferase [Spirochaetota bacterium]HQO21799.1 GNAT family N-acetyltransferase [Spirochaetota bacterium]HQQ22470.1 GNAT family N-acetyltransferase [Spirochaetota bacterium]
MNNIIIRNIEENDIDSIAGLYRLFWDDEQNADKMKMKFRQLRDNSSYIFLCAVADGQVAGTIMGIICDELYGDCRPFLLMEDLVVRNDFRRMKIGTKLLNAMENIGREKGCYQIIFMTERNRVSSVSFYESIGYDSEANIGFKKKL